MKFSPAAALNMLSGDIGRRGKNGTDMPTTPRKRSGRTSAAVHATIEPQSWPTITACFWPSASHTPSTSPIRWKTV